MKTEASTKTRTEERYSATVAIVDRVIDPASNTFGVRLKLPNPDYRLPSGLQCQVRFLETIETFSQEDSDSVDVQTITQIQTKDTELTTVTP